MAVGGALAAAGFVAGLAWVCSWIRFGKGYFLGLLDETQIVCGSSWLTATSVTLLTACVIRFNCCPPAYPSTAARRSYVTNEGAAGGGGA